MTDMPFTPEQIRNFALVGHQGAGKTMLAEAMLGCAGAISRMGSIGSHNTVSDYHPSEKERQISLHADIQQSGVRGVPIREYVAKHQDTSDSPGNAHRDFCFFFGFQDPARFLYIHVAKAGDNNAHQVFVVNESDRTPITDFRTAGANWGLEEWRKIRIVRDLDKGTVEIFFQDMLTPIMIADEVPFEWGFVGFGSFDDTGCVDNIKIWAPESRASEKSFFE